MTGGDSTEAAYATFAPVYDAYNEANDYESWFTALLPRLEALGLPRGGRLLDVGCGTGMAIGPMLRRDWEVVACDLSAEMVEQAKGKFPDGVRFEVCDMRELPTFGAFDLVWALNDPIGYLLEDADLGRALRAMSENLADDGLLVFDCNTLRLFRDSFETDPVEVGGGRWTWRGCGGEEQIYAAEISGEGIATHRHHFRYRSVAEVRSALSEAGLTPLAALGQEEAEDRPVLSPDWNEDTDHKIIHVARRSA